MKTIKTKTLKWVKHGESVPANAVYIKSKTVKEGYEESNWSWCSCPDMLFCTCAKWENVEYHLYEIDNI